MRVVHVRLQKLLFVVFFTWLGKWWMKSRIVNLLLLLHLLLNLLLDLLLNVPNLLLNAAENV